MQIKIGLNCISLCFGNEVEQTFNAGQRLWQKLRNPVGIYIILTIPLPSNIMSPLKSYNIHAKTLQEQHRNWGRENSENSPVLRISPPPQRSHLVLKIWITPQARPYECVDSGFLARKVRFQVLIFFNELTHESYDTFSLFSQVKISILSHNVCSLIYHFCDRISAPHPPGPRISPSADRPIKEVWRTQTSQWLVDGEIRFFKFVFSKLFRPVL